MQTLVLASRNSLVEEYAKSKSKKSKYIALKGGNSKNERLMHVLMSLWGRQKRFSLRGSI